MIIRQNDEKYIADFYVDFVRYGDLFFRIKGVVNNKFDTDRGGFAVVGNLQVEIVRAFGIDTLVEDKELLAFIGEKSIVTVRTT